jgi:hypothetical protein
MSNYKDNLNNKILLRSRLKLMDLKVTASKFFNLKVKTMRKSYYYEGQHFFS